MGRLTLIEGANAPCVCDFTGTFSDWLFATFPEGAGGRSYRLVVNDRIIAPDAYESTEIGENDLAAFAITPGGLDPFTQTVLIVVAAVAISVGISLLLAPPVEGLSGNGEGTSVYSVGVQANKAKLGGPIPVPYGRCVRTPDYASESYRYFQDNDEYRVFLQCLGEGDIDVEGLRIGETPVDDLPDGIVTWESYHPSQHTKTLGVIDADFGIHENVVTSGDVSNQELVAKMKYQDRTTATFSGMVITFTDSSVANRCAVGDKLVCRDSPANGDYIVDSIMGNAVTIEGSLSGTGGPSEFDLAIIAFGGSTELGPFVSNPPGTRTTKLELDFEWPGGLHTRNDDGDLREWSVEIRVALRRIDDRGDVIGGTAQTIIFDESAVTQDPLRKTYVIDGLTAGRYLVSCKRIDFQNINREVDRTNWVGLKAFLNYQSTEVYGDTTILAIKIKAAQALSARSQQRIFAVTQKRIKTNFGSGPVGYSSNAADIIADMIESPYGANLLLADKISADSFAAFHASQIGRSGFNGVFDQETTMAKAMKEVAFVGFGDIHPEGSKLTIVRDVAQPNRASIVTPNLILAGSFKLEPRWSPEAAHDSYEVEYVNPDTFKKEVYRWPADGVRPRSQKLRGVADNNDAKLAARYLWRQEKYRNMDVSFSMEWDALNFKRYERVGVAMPFFNFGGHSGMVRAKDGLDLTLMNMTGALPNGPIFVVLRAPNGDASGVITATGDGDKTVTLSAAAVTVLTRETGAVVPTVLGWATDADLMFQDVIISRIIPSTESVAIEAKLYDERVTPFSQQSFSTVPKDPTWTPDAAGSKETAGNLSQSQDVNFSSGAPVMAGDVPTGPKELFPATGKAYRIRGRIAVMESDGSGRPYIEIKCLDASFQEIAWRRFQLDPTGDGDFDLEAIFYSAALTIPAGIPYPASTEWLRVQVGVRQAGPTVQSQPEYIDVLDITASV